MAGGILTFALIKICRNETHKNVCRSRAIEWMCTVKHIMDTVRFGWSLDSVGRAQIDFIYFYFTVLVVVHGHADRLPPNKRNFSWRKCGSEKFHFYGDVQVNRSANEKKKKTKLNNGASEKIKTTEKYRLEIMRQTNQRTTIKRQN